MLRRALIFRDFHWRFPGFSAPYLEVLAFRTFILCFVLGGISALYALTLQTVRKEKLLKPALSLAVRPTRSPEITVALT